MKQGYWMIKAVHRTMYFENEAMAVKFLEDTKTWKAEPWVAQEVEKNMTETFTEDKNEDKNEELIKFLLRPWCWIWGHKPHLVNEFTGLLCERCGKFSKESMSWKKFLWWPRRTTIIREKRTND